MEMTAMSWFAADVHDMLPEGSSSAAGANRRSHGCSTRKTSLAPRG